MKYVTIDRDLKAQAIPKLAEKLARAYGVCNWRWLKFDLMSYAVPTAPEIAKTIADLLNDVAQFDCCATGGLEVRIVRGEKERIELRADKSLVQP